MLKKLCVLILAMIFLAGISYGEEVGDEYTLPEKFFKQIQVGSGLKGIANFAVSGDDLLAAVLQPLDGAEFDWTYITGDEQSQVKVMTVKDGQNGAVTEVYRNGNSMFLKSDLFQGTVYKMHTGEELLAGFFRDEQNPSFLVPLFHMAKMRNEDNSLDTSLVRLETIVREWVEHFSLEPVYSADDQGSYVMISYEIPADAVREELKTVLHEVLNDPELMTVLRQSSSEEQKQTYLNRDMEQAYSAIIDSIILDNSVRYQRKVTLQGEEVSSRIELPLSAAMEPWSEFAVNAGKDTEYILKGPNGELQFTIQESSSVNEEKHFQGTIKWIPASSAEKAFSVSIDLLGQYVYHQDDDGVQHEYQTWKYTLQSNSNENDGDHANLSYMQLPVIQGTLQLHFYSKAAKRAATTVEISLNTGIPGGKLQGAAQMRTVSPWAIEKIPENGAVDMTAMTSQERRMIMKDLFANTLSDLQMIDLERQSTQEDTVTVMQVVATETDMVP